MKTCLKFMVIAALLLPLSVVYPQGDAGSKARISFYYVLNNWKTKSPQLEGIQSKESKLNQGVFGLSVNVTPNDRFSLDLGGTFSNSQVPGTTLSLSSLNDTQLRGTYFVANRRGSVSLYLNLPTGKKELTQDQFSVSAGVSDVSLKFVTRRSGQGLDIGTDWYALPQLGNVTFQIGGGYLYHGKYQVLKGNSLKYKYGDEISGRVGFATNTSPLSAAAGLSVHYYLKDKSDDQDIFQAGLANSIGGRISYSDRFDVQVGFNLLKRGKAKIKSVENTFSDEAVKSGRDEFLLYGEGAFPVTTQLSLLASLELQNVSANDYKEGDSGFRPKSNYAGIGAGIGYALTQTIAATGMATFYTGKINTESDLSGFGLAIILTYRPM
jgi:hypothetical protein